MKTIEHEGQVYVLQADVEAKIQERVGQQAAKTAEWKAQAEEAAAKLAELTDRAANADTLTQQLSTLQEQLETERGRFERFQAAAPITTAPATLAALELGHQQAMRDLPEAQRVGFADWVSRVREQPDLAPPYLRPMLAPAKQETTAPPADQTSTNGADQQPAQDQRPAWAPAAKGQQPAPSPQPTDAAQAIEKAQTFEDLIKVRQQYNL